MRRRVWLGFAVLCVLGGSGWAFDEAVPGALTGLLRTAVHDGALAFVFAIASLFQSVHSKPGTLSWRKIALGAIAMFAVPDIVFAAAAAHLSGSTEVLVFLLVPVVVIFTVAQRSAGFGVEQNPLRMMVPTLAGIGGAALLIPFHWPAMTAGLLWLMALLASALLAGVAALWMQDLLAEAGVLRSSAVAFAAVSLCVAAFCWVDWTGPPHWDRVAALREFLRAVAVDGPILLLTVWLLRAIAPVPFSARLLLVPLVTIVGSYVVLRPPTVWTTWLGIVLLAGGAAGLLRADSQEML
jgi:drug/metabolite transporter (DMT)-like permease